MQNSFYKNSRTGFTLIELVMVIVIMGILGSIAIQKLAPIADSFKFEETRAEMNRLAIAIAGNPDLRNNGVRSDFGYVGDIGALPPNLDALTVNPGYSTWNGPYIENSFEQITNDFKKDAWQVDYVYSAGNTITSVGSGSSIERRLAESRDYLLYNQISGNVFDFDGTPPSSSYDDSITILLEIPNGSGSTITKSSHTDIGGYFSFDSIPIGNHSLDIVYLPDNDTMQRFVSVSPGSKNYGEYYLASNVWGGSSTLPGAIGYYPLDEGSGQVAHDLSGAAFDADLQNDPSGAGWTTGKIGGAFLFDGTNDYFETATNSTDLQLTDDYSISVWVEPDANQVTWAAIVSKCTPTGSDNHWTLQWNNASGSSKALTLYHPSGANWVSSYTLADAAGAWHHIVITYRLSPARVQLYVDGVLHSESTSLATGPGSGTGKFRIGCDQATYTWRGRIDDVRIFDYILNTSEIQTLYDLGS